MWRYELKNSLRISIYYPMNILRNESSLGMTSVAICRIDAARVTYSIILGQRKSLVLFHRVKKFLGLTSTTERRHI